MQYTTNFNLKKPEGTDVVNIDDLNYNADIIDTELGSHNSEIADARGGFDTLREKLDSYAVNVKDFGAKGDGVTDDTQAIQNAINYAISTKGVLISSPDKVYAISKELDITGVLYMQFHGATIKAISSVSSMMCINHSQWYGIIEGVTFDCNHLASIGLYVKYAQKKAFRDITIINGDNILFQIDGGYEVFAENWHLLGTSSTSVGMYIKTGDCHFTDIVIIDCVTAIKTSGSNFYTRIHAWIKTPAYLPNSIFMDILNGDQFCESCYSDTYRYSFYFRISQILKLTNCKVFFNTTIYSPDTMGTTPAYIFFYEGDYSWGTSIQNCSFSGLSFNHSQCLFTNITNFMGHVGLSNNFTYVSGYILSNNTQVSTTSNVTNTAVNSVIRNDGVVWLNLGFYINADTTPTQTTDVFIGTIPYGFCPQNNTALIAYYSSSQYAEISGILYCYISSNGGISIKIPDSASGNIYVNINTTYITNNI